MIFAHKSTHSSEMHTHTNASLFLKAYKHESSCLFLCHNSLKSLFAQTNAAFNTTTDNHNRLSTFSKRFAAKPLLDNHSPPLI